MKTENLPLLDGVTVVDFTRILAGPYCTMVLGDLGAEVLKVESPTGDDSRHWGPPFVSGESAYFLAVNRNKKSLCLDLKKEGGLDVVLRLVEGADVVIENFRPGTMARLGLGYDALAEKNPGLVYCSISGYGQSGPLSSRPGYDAVMQGEAGWMGLTGEPEGAPMKVGASLADIFTGVMASQGILAALYRRERSGRGEHVDVSLFDSVMATLCYQAQGYLLTGDVPARLGNRHSSLAPYETFRTSDSHVIVGVGNDALWKRFVECVGRDELRAPELERNQSRVERYAELRALLEPIFAERTTAQWVELLEDAGIPVGRVRDVAEVFANPQVDSRNMKISVDHAALGPIALTGNPIKLSRAQEPEATAPPVLGADTESVLRERLGLDESDLSRLRSSGAIAR